MFRLVLVALMAIFANAYDLRLDGGHIIAHTEVLGDSKIDPLTKNINATLVKEDNIESLNGKVWIQTLDLKSTNEKRDVNMYELLNATIHPNISFEIKSVQKVQDSYTLNGILTLNGISKEVSSNVKIVEGSDSLSMDGGFSIELTDYGIEPPKMFFLKVRNKIDIAYFLNFKKAN